MKRVNAPGQGGASLPKSSCSSRWGWIIVYSNMKVKGDSVNVGLCFHSDRANNPGILSDCFNSHGNTYNPRVLEKQSCHWQLCVSLMYVAVTRLVWPRSKDKGLGYPWSHCSKLETVSWSHCGNGSNEDIMEGLFKMHLWRDTGGLQSGREIPTIDLKYYLIPFF